MSVNAQRPHPILASFEAIKQPNGVNLRWVISGGFQCKGTRVFRAVQDGNFEEINHIPGLCGSFNADETYSYFDAEAKPNAYNHYKLEMGFQGFTKVETVFVEDFGKDNYLLASDHYSRSYRILFSNDYNDKAFFEVFDSFGNPVHSDISTGSDFNLNASGLKDGIYLFRISGISSKIIQGRMYIGGR